MEYEEEATRNSYFDYSIHEDDDSRASAANSLYDCDVLSALSDPSQVKNEVPSPIVPRKKLPRNRKRSVIGLEEYQNNKKLSEKEKEKEKIGDEYFVPLKDESRSITVPKAIHKNFQKQISRLGMSSATEDKSVTEKPKNESNTKECYVLMLEKEVVNLKLELASLRSETEKYNMISREKNSEISVLKSQLDGRVRKRSLIKPFQLEIRRSLISHNERKSSQVSTPETKIEELQAQLDSIKRYTLGQEEMISHLREDSIRYAREKTELMERIRQLEAGRELNSDKTHSYVSETVDRLEHQKSYMRNKVGAISDRITNLRRTDSNSQRSNQEEVSLRQKNNFGLLAILNRARMGTSKNS